MVLLELLIIYKFPILQEFFNTEKNLTLRLGVLARKMVPKATKPQRVI